ncbi:hypothetical protein OXPF_23020 [Oxobacter pfennigii]|uniref:Uncharacterized protein n=1 Tax=Oxobacter pfennigii TaxID=36849 RepID=A0A0P8W7X2_9CLOT|nr:hypothetical protein [Oxobacter pfennigii]KPU44135.1 hypothetical protein OXPF_23020 [Oxobacter pfennigii]
MLNSIIAGRVRDGSVYKMTLEVPEKEFFEIYSDLDNEAAEDILKQYMMYHADDGRYSDISILHDSNAHVVSIRAIMHYDGNDHTEQFNIPPYLSNKM